VDYDFKLGDFGLALIFPAGLNPPPIPATLSSPNQNPKFSRSDYDPDDDLYGVGYLMTEMQSHLLHPDWEYELLASDLMNKTGRCNITSALEVVERNCNQIYSELLLN